MVGEIKIGFTGRRDGMTTAQLEAIEDIILRTVSKYSGKVVAVDGMCVGADTEFNTLAKKADCYCIAYPGHYRNSPENTSLVGGGVYDEIRESDTHFSRNRRIVDDTNVLLATPRSRDTSGRGGTNYTINYAKKNKKPVYIVYPDGTSDFFGNLDQ